MFGPAVIGRLAGWNIIAVKELSWSSHLAQVGLPVAVSPGQE